MTYRRPHASAGTDRWMVSWADLLTLLFASVVVLYASAARNGFPAAHAKATISTIAPAPAPPPVRDDLGDSFERLRNALRPEISDGRIDLSRDTRGIVVSLRDQSYFTSGSDQIQPSALQSVGEVASVIHGLPNSVRLEGHTDSVPIHNARFRDNWSLSAARSAAVLSLLESRFDIPASRLAIAAYADNQPAAGNESEDGRARNRRVDIVILNQSSK